VLTGRYLARYVKMRELMPESAGGSWNAGRDTPGMAMALKDLQSPGRLHLARREGWKCKEWADSRL
jgi:hypothetical protein